MSVAELLAHEPDPDEARIRDVLSGHLCRCTGYQNIVDAVLLAARRMRGVAHERPRSGRTRRGRRDGEGTPGSRMRPCCGARRASWTTFRWRRHCTPASCAARTRTPASCRSTCPPREPCRRDGRLRSGGSLWRADGMAHAAGIRVGRPAGQHDAVRAGRVGSRVRRRGRDGGAGRQQAPGRGRGGGRPVEYEALAAVADCRAALEEGSPRVRSELESNLLQRYTLEHGDCEAAFAGAGCSPSASGRIEAPRIRWKGAACWRRRTRPAMR